MLRFGYFFENFWDFISSCKWSYFISKLTMNHQRFRELSTKWLRGHRSINIRGFRGSNPLLPENDFHPDGHGPVSGRLPEDGSLGQDVQVDHLVVVAGNVGHVAGVGPDVGGVHVIDGQDLLVAEVLQDLAVLGPDDLRLGGAKSVASEEKKREKIKSNRHNMRNNILWKWGKKREKIKSNRHNMRNNILWKCQLKSKEICKSEKKEKK